MDQSLFESNRKFLIDFKLENTLIIAVKCYLIKSEMRQFLHLNKI